MSIAETSSAESFECTATDCTSPTPGHYCAQHTATCPHCGTEQLASDLDGECGECRRRECEDDLEVFIGAVCWCGHHGGAR